VGLVLFASFLAWLGCELILNSGLFWPPPILNGKFRKERVADPNYIAPASAALTSKPRLFNPLLAAMEPLSWYFYQPNLHFSQGVCWC